MPHLGGKEELLAILVSLPGGFEIAHAQIAASGDAALAQDTKGRIALVAPSGAHFYAKLAGNETKVLLDGHVLTIHEDALMLRFDAGDEADFWDAAIRAARGRS